MAASPAPAGDDGDGGRAPFMVEGVIKELSAAGWAVRHPSEPPPGSVFGVENLAYLRRDNQVLRLDVYRPRDLRRRPAVLILHGGGWESGSRHMERALAKALAAKGFVAIPLSYGLAEHGRFPAAVRDVKAAVRWTRNHANDHQIDPAFVAVIGASAGGQLAALAGASNGVLALDTPSATTPIASLIQAVVDIDGAASFPDPALIAQENRRRGATSRFLGGNYAERPETWRAASALPHVGPQSAPTLFIATNGASPILPGHRQMAARLNALGIVARVEDLPAGTPHPFWLVEPWFTPLVGQVADFLDAQYLESRSAAAPP
jgi:pectinesterase